MRYFSAAGLWCCYVNCFEVSTLHVSVTAVGCAVRFRGILALYLWCYVNCFEVSTLRDLRNKMGVRLSVANRKFYQSNFPVIRVF